MVQNTNIRASKASRSNVTDIKITNIIITHIKKTIEKKFKCI